MLKSKFRIAKVQNDDFDLFRPWMRALIRLRHLLALSLRGLKWFASGVALLVLMVIVLLLQGPQEDLGEVEITLDNRRHEPLTIVDVSLHAHPWPDSYRHPAFVVPAENINPHRIAGPIDLPPGQHLAILTWRAASSSDTNSISIMLTATSRRYCTLNVIITPEESHVTSCRDIGPRRWSKFDW